VNGSQDDVKKPDDVMHISSKKHVF